ncbi:DUF4249 domain-containing protein [Nafulsella turpanensis]|uniref:DUF4249 domain-containing protein n=1 Tax=Nafulsella turpanensis TaxID=1265690 RepID=UPI00034D8266|nr:DUF4249 domain-containing protein [Nafulsella turpanensis]
MKGFKNIIACLSAFSLLLWSCQTVVEIDLPEHEPKLVVNAVFNPDSLLTVDVSASQSAFSNNEHQQLENATVSLFQEGKHLLDFPHIGNGIYQAAEKPEALQQYELRVSAAGFPQASAITSVPGQAVIDNLQATVEPARSDWEGTTLNAFFTLKDTPNEENFYYLQAFTPDTTGDGEAFNRYVHLESSSPIEYEFSMETRLFFSDKLFNGEALELKLNLENNPYRTTYVQIAQVTKEYYQYVKTLDKQSYGDNLNLTPVSVSNNIINGMGLFGAYNAQTLTFKVE